MKTFVALSFCAVIGGLLTQAGTAQASYDLRSPDGRIELRIRTAERLRYDVVLKGRAVLENSTLSLDVEHNKLGRQPKVLDAKTHSTDQIVEPVVRQKFAKIRDRYNELRLRMDGGYAVVFRAYDEGVAYRFETSLSQEKVKIYGEESAFNFSSNFVVYYPQEDGFYSHNERKYLPQHLTEISAEFIATLPAVVDVGQGEKLAIAESDLEDYPGLWLRGTGGTGLTTAFPAYPTKEIQTSDRDYKPVETADYIAETAGTRTYPWRVIGVAEHDGDLLTNQIVYLLQSPSRVQDTSWIKPGKVAWDWWNDWNIDGVDFQAGINTKTYEYYVDFAAKYGIPYIILDDGWYKLGNLLEVTPALNMEELGAYAKQKKVGIILWASWKTLDDQLIPALNLINTEGVRGMEWSKWSRESEPEHNVTLPFTRMFLGPLDYTPGAMRNATKTTFAPINNQAMAMGTRCHQLAMYVVYEGPLQMLSDSPSNYMREPETMEFLSAVPTEWDETKVLDARIADYVVVARRNGKDWYIGAMNDWTPRSLDIDLSFLPDGQFSMNAYQDGLNADRNASDYRKTTTSVSRATKLKLQLAGGGGWAARIHQ